MIVFLVHLVCLFLILSYISWHDIKTRLIPLSGLLGLFGLTWAVHCTQNGLDWFFHAALGIGMALFFIGIRYCFAFYKRKIVLGWGDIWLMLIMGMGLSIEALPLFFILSGVFGLLTFKVMKGQQGDSIPFAPSLCGAYFIVMISRHYFSM